MLEAALFVAVLGFAVCLGMVVADKFVDMTQRRWRYSIRSLMILMALVSFALAVIVSISRK
jgi:MFS family permease